MLMTALQILATPAPPQTRGSCNKNVFSECNSVVREVPRGGLGQPVQRRCHLCGTLGLTH